ncbi:MAG: DOMON domain-containing protein [Candidatus Bipolaricaulia bacterium]
MMIQRGTPARANFTMAWLLMSAIAGLLLLTALNGARLSAASGGPTVEVDGMINPEEYQFHYTDPDIGMEVHWAITDHDLYVGLKAPARGWLGFGLYPGVPFKVEVMKGADIYIAYVAEGEVFGEDHFADSPYGHKPDDALGGAADIAELAGSEDAGFTTIEFKRALNTLDKFDADVPVRGLVYLAYAEADNFTAFHTAFTEAIFNFATGRVEKQE